MTHHGRWVGAASLMGASLVLSACGGSVSKSQARSHLGTSSGGDAGTDAGASGGDATELTDTFAVSDYFTASGYLGDATEPGLLSQDDGGLCQARSPGARGECYRFTYQPGALRWAGVYWLYPSNSWGSREGRPISTAKLRHVSLQAAVLQGSEFVDLVIGGVNGPRETPPGAFSDQFQATTTVTVTDAWQHFEVELPEPSDPNVPITSLLGAFAWTMNEPEAADGAASGKTLFIDDLVYE